MATTGSLNFLSASEVGTHNSTGTSIRFYSALGAGEQHIVFNDFVGLNTNIYEPVTSSENYLGYPNTTNDPSQDGVSGFSWKNDYLGGLQESPIRDAVAIIDNADYAYILNGLIHHRNGPYSWPTWKQYRGWQHPVAKDQRLHNTMSIDTRNPKHIVKSINMDNYGPEGPPGYHTTAWSGSVSIQNLKQFYEPSVISKYKPFIYDVPTDIIGGQRIYVRARQSMFNQMTYFSNDKLNDTLKLSNADPRARSRHTRNKQEVYSLFYAARNPGDYKPSAVDYVFHETIYPRGINAYRKFKLEKPNYEEVAGYGTDGYDRNHGSTRSYWRDIQYSTASSSRFRTIEQALNTQDITQSMIYTPQLDTLTGIYGHWVQHAYDFDAIIGQMGTGPLDTWFGSYLKYLPNGIITNQSSSMVVDVIHDDLFPGDPSEISPDEATTARSTSIEELKGYIQLDSYQPYQINLNSMWPLDAIPYGMAPSGIIIPHVKGSSDPPVDPAAAITKYDYFTPGNDGTQIGLTPHAQWRNSCITGALQEQMVCASLPSNASYKSSSFSDIGTIINGFSYALSGQTFHIPPTWVTRSAGELAYSTKPTIFFYRHVPSRHLFEAATPAAYDSFTGDGPIGYTAATASMQYLRHTYPYQSPWWVTNLVIGRNPMYDTYNDFIGNDIKYIARDYTILPEFRISEHYDHYDNFIKTYEEAKDTRIFVEHESYVQSLGAKAIKIKRNFGVPTSTSDPKAGYISHKLSFLTLHGAEITSSSPVDDLEQADHTTNRYEYDDIYGVERLSDNTNTSKHYRNVSGSVIFNQKFVHTDDLRNFTYLMHEKGFRQNTVPKEISFECDGIKKLLPYEGFYPMARTVQIGSYFKKAFEDHIEEGYSFKNTVTNVAHYTIPATPAYSVHSTINDNGEPTAQESGSKGQAMMQALLEPFFAPGLLYNSIKSGIAVDYPVYLKSPPEYYNSCMSASHAIALNENMLTHFVEFGTPDVYGEFGAGIDLTLSTGSFGHGGYHMMGVANAMPAYLKNRPDYRMPFEALYDLSKLAKLHFTDNERNPYANYLVSDFLWGSGSVMAAGGSSDWLGTAANYNISASAHGSASLDYQPNVRLKNDPTTIDNSILRLYESAINNYLSETMEFFLAPQDEALNIKFPIIMSKPQRFLNVAPKGKKFQMDLRLEMGVDQVMCEGPRKSNFIYSGSIPFGEGPLSSSLRGYLYGPPIEVIPELPSNLSALAGALVGRKDGLGYHMPTDFHSAYAANLSDPAYQAWTPPYFYGSSRIILSVNGGRSALPIAEAFEEIVTSSFYRAQYDITGGLTPKLPSIASTALASFTRMKIDASIDIFNELINVSQPPAPQEDVLAGFLGGFGAGSQQDPIKIWYAMPKWVCPVLDFSSSYTAHYETIGYTDENVRKLGLNLVSNPYHSEKTGRSMWGGYGTDPYDPIIKLATWAERPGYKAEKGIYFSIADSFPNLEEEPVSSPTDLIPGDFSEPGSIFLKKSQMTTSGSMTGSLSYRLGIENVPKKFEIGKMANQKDIHEAIAIIPYFEEPVSLNFIYTTSADPAPLDGDMRMLEDVFTTRQIIPGKHFLGIHSLTFENILSAILTEKYYKRDSLNYEQLTKHWLTHKEDNQSTLQNAMNCDVGKMITSLIGHTDIPGSRGFQLPPEFDFIHNKDIKPFQMIVVPFSHQLNKQDLINIYQGIMPDISLRAEKIFRNLTVHPGPDYAVDDPNLIPSYARPITSIIGATPPIQTLATFNLANFLSPLPLVSELRSIIEKDLSIPAKGPVSATSPTGFTTTKEYYEKMKFMVFKIKQRAVSNYKRYKDRSVVTMAENRAQNPSARAAGFRIDNLSPSSDIFANEVYGINWPYDNFSLIEAAKMDIKIKVVK